MANENVTLSDIKIQWHPAFCAAAELELSANKAVLDFQREYNLSKKPLQIDLLVIKKLDDVEIENEIGRIFKRDNIIEYKSPGDSMTIDDFFKTVGYAYIYKGLGETVDQIPVDCLTVSLFREGYPEELFHNLNKCGLTVEKKFEGVYYVSGLLIPAQVVVTKELNSRSHKSLKILSRNATEEDIRRFVEEAQNFTSQGERANVDAVLQVSVSANYKLYDEMKRRYPEMCEAIRRLMREEIEDEMQKARRDGVMEGKLEGKIEEKRDTALTLAERGMSISDIAEIVRSSVETVQGWLSGNMSLIK